MNEAYDFDMQQLMPSTKIL
jgi:hypothetical protein